MPNRLSPLKLIASGFVLLMLGISAFAAEPKPWSFKPIEKPALPKLTAEQGTWVRQPIDAFIVQKLAAKGLQPSPEAERRVLARRVSINLTGLPPTPEELKTFLEDASPTAYEKLVDRLLASPRYGERWARHWLDVAHYADSHGQDQDRFRPNAWPYRDYVIRAFNNDKPYAMFVKEQIAGDVLSPNSPDAITATGFLAAGPWDESGLRDINENSLDRQIARYLDRDDIVTSTMTSFAGLTVHCARCHQHKFDPISQADYYALQAVFAGIDKAERSYDADPTTASKRQILQRELERLKQPSNKPSVAHVEAVSQFEKTYQQAEQHWTTLEAESAKSANGASLKVLRDRSILAVGASPPTDVYTIQGKLNLKQLTAVRLEVLPDDTLPMNGPGRCHNGNLHLSEVRMTLAKPGSDTPLTLKIRRAIADFDQEGWGIAKAIDGNTSTAWGIHPKVGQPHQAVFELEPVVVPDGATLQVELDQLHGGVHTIGRFRLSVSGVSLNNISLKPLPVEVGSILAKPLKSRSEKEMAELARWVVEAQLQSELAKLPEPQKVYCGTNQFKAEGSFRPATTPRVIHILKRGEVTRPGEEAKPGSVESVGLPARFNLKSEDEGQRRLALAEWLVDAKNPLTWRVIVNRVWHYHFGKGIVDTPNDFGQMGGTPSHPELLDWLASHFRDSGGSLKQLHKLIVTSSTYRQAVQHDTKASELDAENRLLWRMNRGKLDAETLRDSVLLLSGKLDETRYGPPVKHFQTRPGIHVTPEADYTTFDVDSPEARRRSIYRFIFRTKPDPLLEALDCPDASASAPVRSSSQSAPQALVLWNNKFMLRQAEHLADKLKMSTPDLAQQVNELVQLVYCRNATQKELNSFTVYAAKHGLANLVRVLLNSSEFMFVD